MKFGEKAAWTATGLMTGAAIGLGFLWLDALSIARTSGRQSNTTIRQAQTALEQRDEARADVARLRLQVERGMLLSTICVDRYEVGTGETFGDLPPLPDDHPAMENVERLVVVLSELGFEPDDQRAGSW